VELSNFTSFLEQNQLRSWTYEAIAPKNCISILKK